MENPTDIAGLINLFNRVYCNSKVAGADTKNLWLNLTQQLATRYEHLGISVTELRDKLNELRKQKKKNIAPKDISIAVEMKKQENLELKKSPKRLSKALKNKRWIDQTSFNFGLPL